jgi:hypothetical protein
MQKYIAETQGKTYDCMQALRGKLQKKLCDKILFLEK